MLPPRPGGPPQHALLQADKEDDSLRVGYSKERRVDPQIVVGLLVDRCGFPLEIGRFEGNKAETLTIIPIVKVSKLRRPK